MDLLKKLVRIEADLEIVTGRFEDPGFTAETQLLEEAAERVQEVRERLEGLIKPSVYA
jgi:hypothetical protein